MPPRIKVLGVEDYAGFGKGPHFVNLIKPQVFAYLTHARGRAHAREDMNWLVIGPREKQQKQRFPEPYLNPY